MRQKNIEAGFEEQRGAGFSGTLRDYFAGCALTGLLARSPRPAGPDDEFVAQAWSLADDMLAARTTGEPHADNLDDLL